MVIVFSDFFENVESVDTLFSALQHLKHNKHEVILFQVLDKEMEIDFNYQNRPYLFIDLETGKQQKFNPASIKDQYRQLIKQSIDDLRLKCGQNKIDFIETDIKDGFYHVLKSFLLKRNKMI